MVVTDHWFVQTYLAMYAAVISAMKMLFLF